MFKYIYVNIYIHIYHNFIGQENTEMSTEINGDDVYICTYI
jgi:hypothetical protein